MASEGPLAVGLGANVAGVDVNWTGPTNIYLSDDVNASIGSAGLSDYLSATMSGAAVAFTIADSATIDGIEVLVEAKVGTTGTLDDLFLTKDGSAAVGTDGISGTQALTTSDVVYTFGGAADLWGATWTPTEIKATTFGCLLRGSRVTGAVTVDQIRITVYYTAAGGATGHIRMALTGVG